MNNSSLHATIVDALRSLRFYFMGSSNCAYTDKGCIDFVTNQFLTNNFFIACKKSLFRILSCNPFTKT